jgi:hypothetical protein
MVLGLVGLTLGLAACPGDDTGGTGTDGDTDATSTGMTTVPSTTSPSTSTTMATTDMTTTPTTDMTTDMTTSPTTDMTTDMTTDATTTGPDECTPCVEENCGDQIGVCIGIEECACWLECTAAGNDEPTCLKMCKGPPPMRFNDFLQCVAMECTEECFGGGTGTGTGTGGGGDGQYEECMGMMMCPDGMVCNMFLNYCSIECDGDDDACPAPASGDATPICSGISNTCVLPCNDGETCPDNLECTDVGMGQSLCSVPA